MAYSDLLPSPLSHSHGSFCPPGLPAAADRLLDQISAFCEDLLGLSCGNPADDHFHLHSQQQSPRFSRTPQLSTLGFASLLLGISSTLMFFGSFAFFLGLMLMPFILPLAFVASIGILLASFKTPLADLCSIFPSSSSSPSNDPVLLAKLGF